MKPEEGQSQGALIWVGEWVTRQIDKPAELQRELDGMQRRFQLRVSVYTNDNKLVAHIGDLLEPVDASAFVEQDIVQLPDRTVAFRGSHGYTVTSIDLETHRRAIKYLVMLTLLLGLFALGNVPLIRSIARPLSSLAATARAFGGGNMRARTGMTRRDEIGDVAAAFDEMADAVEAARMAEKELLANVSHELRTPLARIRVVHELAAEKFPDVAQRYMTSIASDLGELERLISDIILTAQLDLSTVRNDVMFPILRLGPLPLGPFVEDVIGQFRELHPERVVTTNLDYEIRVVADRMLLRRAVTNVLENAHAYARGDAAIDVKIAAAPDRGTVAVEVADRGPGIAAKDLAHVFTPFFRADPSRSRHTGGIGLGLSLTRRILQAHGGNARIESVVNEGTTVILALPLTR